MGFDVTRSRGTDVSESAFRNDDISFDPDKLAKQNDAGPADHTETRDYDPEKLAVSVGDASDARAGDAGESPVRREVSAGGDELNIESRHIYLHTRNESLEGDCHPITGVPFERKTVYLENGDAVEGVFPVFDSAYDAKIGPELYKSSNHIQFKECNRQLLDAIEGDPDLRARFTSDQIKQIEEGVKAGTAPDGFVWHHNEELGVMQLVDFETHMNTGHTGGRSIWAEHIAEMGE